MMFCQFQNYGYEFQKGILNSVHLIDVVSVA